MVCNTRAGLLRRFPLLGGGYFYTLHQESKRGPQAVELSHSRFLALGLDRIVDAAGGWRTV